jgi:hypothetical protein
MGDVYYTYSKIINLYSNTRQRVKQPFENLFPFRIIQPRSIRLYVVDSNF